MLKPAAKRTLRGAIRANDGFWKARNKRSPRILVYTDSRGQNVSTRAAGIAKHHLGSHIDGLQRDFSVEHYLAPHSHTTIVDFLDFMDGRSTSDYDAVLLHCGIVDFSPRPASSLDSIRQAKLGSRRFDELFEVCAEYHASAPTADYDGQRTVTLYSEDYLQRRLLPELKEIENLVWISSNDFVPGWHGNWRPRPSDIDPTVRAFDAHMLGGLRNCVDLHTWSFDEVQKYTVDNVHFTRSGFAAVLTAVRPVIDRVVES